jgi:hypothetical protein
MNYLPREKWYSEAESRKAFREVQAQAYAQKDTFLGDAKDVTNEIEGVTFPPEVEEKAVKVNEERAASKYMIRGYFSDVLRTTLIIDTPETGLRVVDAMRSKGYEIWTNPLSGRPDLENLYEDANQGYKHVVVKLVKGEGDAVVKELQMITAAMQKAKHDLGGHDIYEIVRSVDEIVIQGGVVPENVLELTQGLKSFSDALYSKALSLDLASDNFIADPTAIRAAISEAVGALPANLVASANDILYVLKQPNSASSYAPLWESFTSNLSAFMEKSTSSDSSIAQSDSENNVLYQETFDPAEPMGEVPLNGTPVTRPEGIALHELNSEQVRPMFERMRQEYKRAMAENRAFKFGNLDGDTQTQVRKWLKGTVQSDLASTKAGALAYGEQMRDASLLNYQKRYGVDNITELFFPYQFWYTRTMLGWARRMVDKPGWFAMYARLKRAQEEQEEKNQMPTRLRGKMRLAMPWLPEWTGRGIWSDPLKQIFPFAQFGQPVERFAQDKNMIDKRAEAILTEMVEEGRATYADAQTAKVNKEGALWKQAVTQAEAELDKNGNPANLVSMMMGPALWWTIPSHLAAGKPEKVGPFPITRTGQTIRTLGEGTFLQPATDLLGGALAGPEEFIKRRGGLSEFGEWGDYYIDRHLSNMAAEGVISAADAQLAMIERTGKIFEMAKQRVAYEQMIRTPMVLPLLAMKEKASPGEIFAAALSSIFPGGLFPEGELKQRGLKVEFDQAYKQFKAGDMDALNGFFDEHPEYEARLALWDEPEERLRQFLINAVWDGYYGLEHPNRKLAVRQLGPEFERFLDKETRNEQGMDVQLLAYWAQTFKEMRLPNVAELEGMQKPEPLALYPSEMEQKIMAYQQEREAMVPNYYALQSNYYALPQGAQRKAFLMQFPELKQYWGWKDAQRKANPDLADYFGINETQTNWEMALNDVDKVLMPALLGRLAGQPLSVGANAELRRLYEMHGRGKGLTMDDFIWELAVAVGGR